MEYSISSAARHNFVQKPIRRSIARDRMSLVLLYDSQFRELYIRINLFGLNSLEEAACHK